jgi:hypothetical protein
VNIIITKPSACTGNVGWSNFLLVLELRQITVKHRESSMVFVVYIGISETTYLVYLTHVS